MPQIAWHCNEDYCGIIRKYCGILEYREWLNFGHSLFCKYLILWMLCFRKRLRILLTNLKYIIICFFVILQSELRRDVLFHHDN